VSQQAQVRGLGLGANVRTSDAPVLMGIAHKIPPQCVEAPTQVGNPFVWPTKVDHCERKWCTMHTKTLQLSLTWNVRHWPLSGSLATHDTLTSGDDGVVVCSRELRGVAGQSELVVLSRRVWFEESSAVHAT
jgi:hypothetical protein